MIKICFIGCVDLGENLFDGQTLKTRLIYKQLKKDKNLDIFLVDTFKKRKIKIFFKTIFGLFKCRKVCCLLSKRGRNVFFKIFNIFLKFKKIEVIHIVIGGYFSKQISGKNNEIQIVKKFLINIVETESMKRDLINNGVTNCVVVPNFRDDEPKHEIEMYKNKNKKFIMFCRVMEEKGVSSAINVLSNFKNVSLDIYGPIDENYKEKFIHLLDSNSFVKYRGIIDRYKAKEILGEYYMMLFPSFWEGEGFPGTLVDSLFAGLPVLSSNWNSNSEIIKNNENGLVFSLDKTGDFSSKVSFALNNVDTINSMRKNCLKEAKKYTLDKNMQIYKKYLYM